MRVAVCAIVKNEGRYLEEWIAYHAAIGVDHFYIYDNDSTDNTGAILQAAVKAGICTAYDWPRRDENDRPQPRAYKHCLENHRADCDWLLILDADELLNLKKHATVQAFLADYPDADAIGINWRMFGDSGQVEYQPGLLMERFTKAASEGFGPNHIIKTITRTRSIVEPGIHSHRLVEGAIFINSEGHPLKLSPAVRQDSVSLGIAQINHYFTKTREEWAFKRARGKADHGAHHEAFIRPDTEFDFNNRNDETDETIQTRLSITNLLRRLVFG